MGFDKMIWALLKICESVEITFLHILFISDFIS